MSSTQVTLKEALDEVKRTAKCARVAEKKVLQKLNECRLPEKIEAVEKQNFEMSEILTSVQNELEKEVRYTNNVLHLANC